MDAGAFSYPQALGYCAFIFGTAGLLQKVDWKLKALMSMESLSYFAHFWMMGNLPAAASGGLSFLRSVLSIRFQSKALGAFFILLHILSAILFVRDGWGLLPVLGSTLATWGYFTMKGIPMRVLFLVCTGLWLVNNIHTGSIGGSALEAVLLVANASTILRLRADEKAAAQA